MIPFIHAELSAKRFGGVPEDYLDIHELMDSSKAAFPNNAHRVLTHNSWFVVTILPKVFGHQRTNSAGKKYNVKDVGEYHILEDFKMKFIPSVQDYLENSFITEERRLFCIYYLYFKYQHELLTYFDALI
jgi:hypothetical protein